MSPERVLVGMSGGVDSAVAAAELVAQGYDVTGLTLQLYREEEGQPWHRRSCCKVGFARYTAETLGIRHETRHAEAAFQAAVVDDFIAEYRQARTPNPCVRCNERIKLSLLLETADAVGARYVATGHYVRREVVGHQVVLKKAADPNKDQSYFLYRLTQATLQRALFPLGGFSKDEVWAKAAALGLPVEEMTESQEVCFVTQGGYRAFLEEQAPDTVRPGQVRTIGGEVLGTHRGVAFYTVGQRRGLGVPSGRRLYVVELDAERNEVVLGEETALRCHRLLAGELTWISGEWPSLPAGDGMLSVTARVRYRGQEVPVTLERLGDYAAVTFQHPQRTVAAGQSVVFYAGETVLGGGIIQETS